jgi:tRNA A-37 threonylcarbamoyl transferase component Bud32
MKIKIILLDGKIIESTIVTKEEVIKLSEKAGKGLPILITIDNKAMVIPMTSINYMELDEN